MIAKTCVYTSIHSSSLNRSRDSTHTISSMFRRPHMLVISFCTRCRMHGRVCVRVPRTSPPDEAPSSLPACITTYTCRGHRHRMRRPHLCLRASPHTRVVSTCNICTWESARPKRVWELRPTRLELASFGVDLVTSFCLPTVKRNTKAHAIQRMHIWNIHLFLQPFSLGNLRRDSLHRFYKLTKDGSSSSL